MYMHVYIIYSILAERGPDYQNEKAEYFLRD
jgi:hypothetical protein